MPDYSACTNSACSRALDCARFRMVWGTRQTVSSFDENRCSHFVLAAEIPWPVLTRDQAEERTEAMRAPNT